MHTILSNTRLLILSAVLILVGGLSAISTLPRAEDPLISNRNASVTTLYPGASALRVEALVTEPLEQAFRQLKEIKTISSSSRAGVSVITIELVDEVTDGDPVWSRVRDKINDVTLSLPSGSVAPNLDHDHTHAFTYIAALRWSDDSVADLLLLKRYAKELAQQLRLVNGSEFVDEYGYPEEELLVSVDNHKAAAINHNPSTIANAIANSDAKSAAGELINHNYRFGIEVADAIESINRVRNVPLHVDENGFVARVSDVATVARGARDPQTEIALVDGEPAVIVAARMQADRRVDRWTADINRRVEQFESQLPSNIQVQQLFSQKGYTDLRLSDLLQSLAFGFALILLVLLVTLGFRSALLVAMALPLTSLLTLTMMRMTEIPINQMSITGLIVALGIMVDNAVVMVDAIAQQRAKGLQRFEAVSRAVKHLWIPLLGSTLTTVLSFMPIALMPGATGEFVSAIAITVSFSLIGSYLISHTIIAGFAATWLASPSTTERSAWYHQGLSLPKLSQLFRFSVAASLRHPWLALMLVSVLPITGFWSMSQLTEQFFPASDRDMFELQVFLPANASIEATQSTAVELNNVLGEYPEVEQVSWMIGANFPSFYYNMTGGNNNSPYFAQAMIKTRSFRDANRLIPILQQRLNQQVTSAQILVRKLEQGPPFNAPIEVRLYGHNLDTLKRVGEDIRLLLAQTPNVSQTRETLQPGVPKVWLDVDEISAQLSGYKLNQVANSLQSSLYGQQGGFLLEGTESVPVRVRLNDKYRKDIQGLNNIYLTTPSLTASNGVAISSLADYRIAPSHGAIPRRNGERVNIIEGFVATDVLPQSVQSEFKLKLDQYVKSLPPGYRVEFGGESSQRSDAVGQLLANVSMVVALMVLVVVVSFNSFRVAGIIFTVAFFAAGLGLLSVWVFDYPFGFTVIIALLGIIGLAINAAIVILAEIRADDVAALGERNAVTQAVMSCTRHITSTTITTIGGFVPLIIAGGGFWPPFAVAIAGGTALATLLSFYFVPVAYTLLKGVRKKTTDSKLVTVSAQ